MTDPFDALREPVRPADPDPGFARRLREQLTREVFAFSGGTMSQQVVQPQPETQPEAQAGREPARAPSLTPYIVVSDARRAIDWYVQVLGAHHRAALTLRYLDGLPVPEVARHLDRTVHATEALLVRARAAFRRTYAGQEGSQ